MKRRRFNTFSGATECCEMRQLVGNSSPLSVTRHKRFLVNVSQHAATSSTLSQCLKISLRILGEWRKASRERNCSRLLLSTFPVHRKHANNSKHNRKKEEENEKEPRRRETSRDSVISGFVLTIVLGRVHVLYPNRPRRLFAGEKIRSIKSETAIA